MINRLDFETSGALLAARNRETWLLMREALLKGQIKKSYLLLVEGAPPQNFEIDAYIGARKRRSSKVKVFKNPPASLRWALQACTQFEKVYLFEAEDCALLRARAASARRHQVRAHSSFAGFPLVGDELYSSTRKIEELTQIFLPAQSLPKFFLHAETVSFRHPRSGKVIDISIEPKLRFREG